MTVSYTRDVANGGALVSFWRVMIRWRGSLYKLIWQDLLCYCVLFVVINYVHNHTLSPHMQQVLQKLRGYLSTNISLFPVPFVLSFFVKNVATKWWHQYQMVPSPDTLAIYTNAAIPGKDERSRVVRRTIVRYAVLSLVLTLRNISTRIKKRFPTIKHIEEAGLILEEEKIHYDKLETQVTANNWMPLVWAANIATHAKSLGMVSSDQCLRLLISELTAHRDKLGTLVSYDLVNIPLVYTQTMVVVVVSYVVITLISHQPFGDGAGYPNDNGFTISSLTNFIIYVGLMKVATVMLNPFGEDDDDFEVNATVDRHITAAYMIVDEMHEEEPEVVKDVYWDEIVPKELPYTVGSASDRKGAFNLHGDEPIQTNKETKRIFNGIRRISTRKTEKKWNKTKGNNDHERTLNDSLEGNYYSLGQLHGVQPKKTTYPNDNFAGVDLYDCPYPTEFSTEAQQPSTSKQYLSDRKRY